MSQTIPYDLQFLPVYLMAKTTDAILTVYNTESLPAWKISCPISGGQSQLPFGKRKLIIYSCAVKTKKYRSFVSASLCAKCIVLWKFIIIGGKVENRRICIPYTFWTDWAVKLYENPAWCTREKSSPPAAPSLRFMRMWGLSESPISTNKPLHWIIFSGIALCCIGLCKPYSDIIIALCHKSPRL